MSTPQPTIFKLAGEGTPRTGALGTELAPAQLAAARKRILGATVVLGLTMLGYHISYRTVWADQATLVGPTASLLSVLVFGVFGLYVIWVEPTRRRLVGAGIAFQLSLGLALAVMEPFDVLATDRPYTLISWNCVNILMVPAFVPASPRFIVGFAFLLACLTPLGFGSLAGVADAPALSMDVQVSLWAPPFICALAVAVPARLVAQLRSELSSARQLGAYELVERLGQGGMGEVWRARHRFLKRPAAIKRVLPELLGDQEEQQQRALARFEREAQAIANLESPHTVKLFDFGVADDGAFFYVMELLRGVDLQRLVNTHGPLPPERAVHLLLQVCDSLVEAHGLGLVHRDIKAANLFVGPRGAEHDVVRVLDFGLVKDRQLERADDIEVTHEGAIQGTPATIAPEAATGKGAVDHRADLYAVGCVAFFLLTGRNPFEGETAIEMVVAHVSEEPKPPSRFAESDVPEALDAVVLACLAKDPEERVGSAAELADRLSAIEGLPAWTPARAREWWQRHEPARLARRES